MRPSIPIFIRFSVALEMRTGSFRGFLEEDEIIQTKRCSGNQKNFITEDMTGMCGDRALRTLRR